MFVANLNRELYIRTSMTIDVVFGSMAVLLYLTTYSCAGDCHMSTNIAPRHFSDTIINYTIVGPIMSSFTASNERKCERECHLAIPDMCYMFNYYPSSKVCELFYKDRAAEYKVEKKIGSTFKTRKCAKNPCLNGGQCYSLGDQTSTTCICKPMFRGAKCKRYKCVIPSKNWYFGANYSILGPVLKTLTDTNWEYCECACQRYDQGLCYMFNYYPLTKVCELFYKNRSAEYRLKKTEGATFKAPKCAENPCFNGGKCISLGHQNLTNRVFCACEPMFNGFLCKTPTCDLTSNVSLYTELKFNYSIVGSLLWSFIATNESACECACNEKDQGLCYTFNYNPSTKVCELFHKDTAAQFSVIQREGSTFKARKCANNLCFTEGGQCFSLGDNNSDICLCNEPFHGTYCHVASSGIKVNTDPVCIGAKGNKFGTFVAPFNGKVRTFRLVHLSGGVAHIGWLNDPKGLGNWGTKEYTAPVLGTFPMKIELHVTDEWNTHITPPPDYPMDMTFKRMGYDLPGYTNMSPELVFPEVSPQITVKKGQRFRIWFGQDLSNWFEHDNLGTTCADVYIYYTE